VLLALEELEYSVLADLFVLELVSQHIATNKTTIPVKHFSTNSPSASKLTINVSPWDKYKHCHMFKHYDDAWSTVCMTAEDCNLLTSIRNWLHQVLCLYLSPLYSQKWN
jgi:hypothetical protein